MRMPEGGSLDNSSEIAPVQALFVFSIIKSHTCSGKLTSILGERTRGVFQQGELRHMEFLYVVVQIHYIGVGFVCTKILVIHGKFASFSYLFQFYKKKWLLTPKHN